MSAKVGCCYCGEKHAGYEQGYQRGLAEGRQQITRGYYQNGYEDGRNDGIKIGRAGERAAIVAWLDRLEREHLARANEVDESKQVIHQMRAMGVEFARDDIERADHLRPDIKDGEGESDVCEYCLTVNPGRTTERGFKRCNKCGEPGQ